MIVEAAALAITLPRCAATRVAASPVQSHAHRVLRAGEGAATIARSSDAACRHRLALAATAGMSGSVARFSVLRLLRRQRETTRSTACRDALSCCWRATSATGTSRRRSRASVRLHCQTPTPSATVPAYGLRRRLWTGKHAMRTGSPALMSSTVSSCGRAMTNRLRREADRPVRPDMRSTY